MTESQREINDYLLGKSIRPELEKELLTNEGLFEEFLIQEDEIIDDYVRWQTTFLITKERKSSLRFAELFHRYLAEQQTV
jgi:hypothetical protein